MRESLGTFRFLSQGLKVFVPVAVQVDHGHVVSEGGRQPRSVQGVLDQEFTRRVAPLLQQQHSSAVIGSGRSRHHRQVTTAGDSVPRIQGKP